MKFLIIPSQQESVDKFVQEFEKLLAGGDAVTINMESMSERTLPQNALMHLWLREYAAHLLKKSVKLIGEREVGYMKMTAKRRCYAATHWDFLIETKHDLITDEMSKGLTSSRKWSKGEMFQFMEWLQAFGAEDGLILEGKGEYEVLKNGAS